MVDFMNETVRTTLKMGQALLEKVSNQSQSSTDSTTGKLVCNATFFVDGTVYVHPEDTKQHKLPNLFDIFNPKEELPVDHILRVQPREVLQENSKWKSILHL